MAEPVLEIRGDEEVKRLLDKLPEATFQDVKEVFKDATFSTHKKVTDRFVRGPLHTRTGEGKRSFKTQVSGTSLASVKASVFSGAVKGNLLVYIPVHEFGATGANAIKAKNAYKKVPGGPYLNIPLDANKTAAGVMRQSAKDVFNAGGFIFRSVSRKWFVAAKDGTPMFILKKSVEIKARLGFYNIADKEVEIVQKKLSALLPKTWGGL